MTCAVPGCPFHAHRHCVACGKDYCTVHQPLDEAVCDLCERARETPLHGVFSDV